MKNRGTLLHTPQGVSPLAPSSAAQNARLEIKFRVKPFSKGLVGV